MIKDQLQLTLPLSWRRISVAKLSGTFLFTCMNVAKSIEMGKCAVYPGENCVAIA